MKNKIISSFLAVFTALSLTACDNNSSDLSHMTGMINDDFQKNLHQTDRGSYVETEEGYYFTLYRLCYIDKKTGKVTIVCGKPDCDHKDDNACNAAIPCVYLLKGGDRLYFVDDTYTDDGEAIKEVKSVNGDATGLKTEQKLKFNEFSASQSSYDDGIYHRGYIYYVSDDIIYRVKPDADKDAAEIVWSPENPGETQLVDGGLVYNPNWIHYMLWADGDFLYFMTKMQDEDEVYKQMLFQCDLTDMSVKMVWKTPGADEVGEWETTGVSVSQWYINDGYIYFYLSGGDMWRSNLSTGENEKLAETHEKTLYGSAVFNDEYMCLLNDIPVFFYGYTELYPGGMFRSMGDTVYVYKTDGTFVRELSLTGLYDDPDELAQIDMLFCDDNSVYFLTTGMTASTSGDDNMSVQQGNRKSTNLCRGDINTGKVEIIYSFSSILQ